MSGQDLYVQINSPGIIAEIFGDEVVVLDTGTGRYFSLTGSAAYIWIDLANGYSARELTDMTDAAVDATRLQAVHDFVTRLLSEKLVVAAPAAASKAEEREASRLSAAGLFDVPELKSFDDMSDLLLADPIHDVDEQAGWPFRRQANPG